MKPRAMTAAAVAAILCAAAIGCKKQPQEGGAATMNSTVVWTVLQNGHPIGRIEDRPGVLVSRAAPPPDGKALPTHRFATVISQNFATEGAIQKALEASGSFAEFKDNVQKAGFEVRPWKEEDDRY